MTDIAVVDASVAVKWLLPEPGRDEAAKLLDQFESEQIDLIAPPLIRIEVANTLSKRCRQHLLDRKIAEALFDSFELRTPMLVERPLRRALRLSLDLQISLWDSAYLALAMDYRTTLWTADRRLYRSVHRHYPFTSLIA